MVIDKFSPQDEDTHPNRGQFLLSVKEIISQDTLKSTLNFWHFEKNNLIASLFLKTLILKKSFFQKYAILKIHFGSLAVAKRVL